MYKAIKINNFRCFEKFEINDLEQINLIVGSNNTGKTALLEAIFLHCGQRNPELALRVNAFRGIESIKIELAPWTSTPWDSLFFNFDNSKTIEIIGKNEKSGVKKLSIKILRQPHEMKKIPSALRPHEYRAREESEIYKAGFSGAAKVLELKFEEKKSSTTSYLIIDQHGQRIEPILPVPSFPAFFQASNIRIPSAEVAERYGNLEIAGKQKVLIEALRLIEPRLKRLSILPAGGVSTLHGDTGIGRPVPLPLMGEGMVKIANIILHISNASHGVGLIDEIENGIHYSVLKNLWSAIRDAAKEFDVQLFATTHSLECVAAAHRAFSEGKKYNFRLFRLERENGSIKAISYDRETLEIALESDLEVR